MRTSDFDYDLPQELIAQRPLEPRDSSRLLVVERFGSVAEHRVFRELDHLLRPEDVLVINDTRVMPARLHGVRRKTGARVELLLLRPFSDKEWEVLVKPGRRVRPEEDLDFSPELSCKVLSNTDVGGRRVRFHCRGALDTVLEQLGETPLPPYIHEQLQDKERYQTIFSREAGSAAAPTAGLHFTEALLRRIREKGVDIASLTLHVGLGTFRPVEAENVEEHAMHAEFYRVSAETAALINGARARGGRVIAVGTTVVRTLETLSDRSGTVQPGAGWTDIFIFPGYTFRAVDAMITNFHLPCSSLLMLVSAFAGIETIRQSYQTAIKERYRFFSFGDAMLLI